MQFHLRNVSLVVGDMNRSREFYKKLFDVNTVEIDGDIMVVIEPESQLWLRPAELYAEQTGESNSKGGAVVTLFADGFTAFAERLEKLDIEYVHKIKELATGQRVVRIFDPDRHVIEVVEDYAELCDRLIKSGMSVKQIAEKTGMPEKFIERRKGQMVN